MNDQSMRDRLVDGYMLSIPFFTINVLWLIVSLPIVTIIPATAALLYAMNQVAHGRPADTSTFIEGLRKWFLRSYLWGGLNLLVIVVLVSNLIFYSRMQQTWTTMAMAVVMVLLVFWLSLQIYTFPLLLEQEEPRLRLAMRNAFVLLARRPLQTLGNGFLIALIVAVSLFVIQPAWLVITASLCGYLANRATLHALAVVMSHQPTADAAPDAASDTVSPIGDLTEPVAEPLAEPPADTEF